MLDQRLIVHAASFALSESFGTFNSMPSAARITSKNTRLNKPVSRHGIVVATVHDASFLHAGMPFTNVYKYDSEPLVKGAIIHPTLD
jgi:hypothetical protein